MKKCGKFEQQKATPVMRSGKSPKGGKYIKVKDVILQTYLTSLLCLVLCVTMFFGTSYAWFTSEVVNTGNEIYIGTLDVELLNKQQKDFSADEKLFDSTVRWEPGYTMLESITLENNGDLAFNYELHFTDGTLADDSTQELNEVASCFEVWYYMAKDNSDAPTVNNYDRDIVSNEKWMYAGSLDELLAGKEVLKGSMDDVRYKSLPTNPEDPSAETQTLPTNPGTTDGINTAHTYYLALHMKEETTAEKVMGQKLTLNVKLIAYQRVTEMDNIEATEGYDSLTVVSYLKDLKDATGNVVLASNITVEAEDEVNDVQIPLNMILDGNNKTISFAEDVTDGVVTIMCNKVNNLTVNGNVTVAYSPVLDDEIETVTLNNCSFDKLIMGDKLESVTLINCKIGGKIVEKAVLTVSVGENGERSWNSDNDLVSVNNGAVTVDDNKN